MRLLRSRGCARRPAEAGLTLVELLVGLAITAILALAAAPFFGEFITNSRLREGGHAVLAQALAAQSEAIKRNRTIRLATNGAAVQVFDRTDPANPVLVREHWLAGGVTASTAALDFGSEGRLAPFPSTGSIDLSISGGSCSGEFRCPGLRIDAGGAVRLCGDRNSGCD